MAFRKPRIEVAGERILGFVRNVYNMDGRLRARIVVDGFPIVSWRWGCLSIRVQTRVQMLQALMQRREVPVISRCSSKQLEPQGIEIPMEVVAHGADNNSYEGKIYLIPRQQVSDMRTRRVKILAIRG